MNLPAGFRHVFGFMVFPVSRVGGMPGGSIPALVACFLLASCASRIAPSGGPKDTRPPEVTRVYPANESTQFSGEQISFDFSEYIQIKDGGTGILISPPLAIPPLVSVVGKSVHIKFREKLAQNTTYTVLIGYSVSDLTEGNALKEYSLVFSTGTQLDSLSLRGTVVDAFTMKPLAGILVMLYPQWNDSLPAKTIPMKLARTDASGNYQITHVPEASYMVFSLDDKNHNFRFDLPEERIGFVDTLVNIRPGLEPTINLRLSENPERRQRLLNKWYNSPGQIRLKYAKPVDTWKISMENGVSDSSWTSTFEPGTDSLIAWIPRIQGDTLKCYSETSSGGLSRTDTIRFSLRSNPSARGRRSTASPDTLLKFTNNLQSGKLLPNDTLSIRANRPLQKVDPSRFILLEEKDTLNFYFHEKLISTRMGYDIADLTEADKKYKLIVLPGGFTDVYGSKNDTLILNFREFNEDDLGTFSMMIKGKLSDEPWLWELANSSGKVIFAQTYQAEQPMRVPNLVPGKYLLRMYVDGNRNRKWDGANLYQKIQAEKIIHYPSEINVRAGWDLELSWETEGK